MGTDLLLTVGETCINCPCHGTCGPTMRSLAVRHQCGAFDEWNDLYPKPLPACEAARAALAAEREAHEETRRERDEAVRLLQEWLATPFFETEAAWEAWVCEYRPRVFDFVNRVPDPPASGETAGEQDRPPGAYWDEASGWVEPPVAPRDKRPCRGVLAACNHEGRCGHDVPAGGGEGGR